jgi:hypothetical protein
MIIQVPDPRRDFDHPLLGHTKGPDASATMLDPAQERLPSDPVMPAGSIADVSPTRHSSVDRATAG